MHRRRPVARVPGPAGAGDHPAHLGRLCAGVVGVPGPAGAGDLRRRATLSAGSPAATSPSSGCARTGTGEERD
jgi:hypothetical protein